MRKLLDGARQGDAINAAGQAVVPAAVFAPYDFCILVVGFIERNLLQRFLTEMHEHGIHRDPVKPSGQRGVAAKGCEFTEYLKECVLSQVFGFCSVVGHSQANGINPGLVRME